MPMQTLQSENLAQDPRVAEAKALLKKVVLERQAGMTGVRSPDPDRVQAYAAALSRLAELRGAAPYFPYLGSGFGNGPLVELMDGSVKYDFITGIGVHAMGHNSLAMLDASVDAVLQDTVMQGFLQGNTDSLELLDYLISLSNRKGANFAHGYLTTSGAMANENAIKIAFQKRQPASRILAFEHCFAGRTLVLAAVTDKDDYRKGLPLVVNVDYIPFYDELDPEGSTHRALEKLHALISQYPQGHACMLMELIQGEGGGYRSAPRAFFVALFEILRANGIVSIIDEIQSFCRTSQPFCFQHLSLDEYVDIVTLGKLSQVCATLVKPHVKPGPGLISQTFTAPTLSIRTGKRIIEHLVQNGHFEIGGKNERIRNSLIARLEKLAAKMPEKIAGPWGEGIMVAFTPFGGDPDKVKLFLKKLFDAGVIAFLTGGKIARARFLVPPGVIEEKHLDEAFAIMENVLAEF